MEQYVSILNVSEDDFTAKYDGEYLTIPAGRSKTVPYDIMVVWMGDPEVRNLGADRERDEAYKNICGFFHARSMTGNHPELLPHLEAYTDDGDRIITIMDDPTGNSLTVDAAEGSDVASLQKQIAAQQKALETLTARLDAEVEVLTDVPEREAEGTGRSAGTAGQKAAAKAAQEAAEKLDPELEAEGADAEPEHSDDADDLPEDTPTAVPMSDLSTAQSVPESTPPITERVATAKAKAAASKTPGGRSGSASQASGRSAGTAGKRRAGMDAAPK